MAPGTCARVTVLQHITKRAAVHGVSVTVSQAAAASGTWVLAPQAEFELRNGCKAPAGKRYFQHTRLADIIASYPMRHGLSVSHHLLTRLLSTWSFQFQCPTYALVLHRVLVVLIGSGARAGTACVLLCMLGVNGRPRKGCCCRMIGREVHTCNCGLGCFRESAASESSDCRRSDFGVCTSFHCEVRLERDARTSATG